MIHSYSAYFDTHLVIMAINIDHVSILFCGDFFQRKNIYSNEKTFIPTNDDTTLLLICGQLVVHVQNFHF